MPQGVPLSDAVRAIIADVRARGDAALLDMAKRFDAVSLESTEVSRASITRALDDTPAPLRAPVERAARNIPKLHSAALPVVAAVATPALVAVLSNRSK